MFGRIREFFAARKQARVMVNLIDLWQSGRPLTPLWDVAKYVDEGYRRNSLIFACVTLKATSFMAPELCAYRAGRDGEREDLPPDHMLPVLLGRPNPRQSQSAFLRAAKTHLECAGNVYVFKRRTAQGMPIELQLLRPDLVRPIPDTTGAIRAYVYGKRPDSGVYSQEVWESGKEDLSGEAQVIPATDVIHEMASPDPLNPYSGLSAISVLARMGDLDNFAADYLRSFFLNAGVPAGILKFKTQTDDTERARAREIWREHYGLRTWERTHTGGTFDIAVTDSEVDYQEIGTQNRFMGLETVFGETESRICGTLGVHPILVASWIGLMRSTMANYEQARKSLYQDTLMPDWISFADRLTVDLAAEFGDDLIIEFDLDDVPELQRDKTEERKLWLAGWDSGLITKNECRGQWDLQPDLEGDVYKLEANVSYEPAMIEMQQAPALPRGREMLRLIGPAERHAISASEWKQLHRIADKAAPEVKKNF